MDSDFDVIVVGAGLAGIATSLACADRGQSVLLTEKADQIGGAAAYSNGQVWIPANPAEFAQGIDDSIEDGITYVRAIAEEHGHPELLDEACMLRWLHTAPVAAAYFARLGAVEWTVIDGYPDYFHPEAPGSRGSGRYLAAYFDGDRLGKWRKQLVVSPHFTMGVTYDELFAKGLGQADADEAQPADFLTWGTGLVAGFLARLVQEPSVTILTNCDVTDLILADDRVCGIAAQHGGGTQTYTSKDAVVLATSSVDWDPDLVNDFLGVPPEHYGSLAPSSLTGDGLRLAIGAGANVLRMPPGHAPMVPGCRLPGGEVSAVMQHAQPHSFIVDRTAERFCDDALYWEMVKELLHADAQLPCFMIFDEQHHNRYGLGTIPPGAPYPAGLVVSANSFEELGERLGLDGEVLAATAARFNGPAARGEDPEFGRGKNQTWRMAAGDPSYPNPNVGAVTEPPYHGLRLVLTGNGIGLSGIDVDPDARVLDEHGEAIPGLFAAGSCAAFKTSGLGFNSGFPLSRCITHAYLIADALGTEAAAADQRTGLAGGPRRGQLNRVMSMRIGVDVGGTFTDLIVLDEASGEITVAKGPTIPDAVDEGVRKVVVGALSTAQVGIATHFLHGTTVGLNALLERRGARVGILTTKGFRDVLETRRLLRLDERGERVWDRLFRTPDPLVERPLRLGVPERVAADGTVLTALDPGAVAAAAATFIEQGVECVAVVLINSHANPAHELEAAEQLVAAGFTGEISLSHRVTGQYREYERTSTTVIDAYVRPAVAGYLARLESGLGEEQFDGEFLITTSSGGCIAFGEARSRPFETVMSGPVAGAVGARSLCGLLGIDLAITADVGGTSFDTCLLVDGRPTVKYEGEVVGMPLQTPWVDVRSVGAGGGSIAFVDHGLLRVGPLSAGADPGPVCYARGGTQPTVTDAAVVLGMLARHTLASGMSLDVAGARGVLERLGALIGLDPDRAAQGVMRVAGASMAGAIRAVSTEVGQDPRDAALIAFGGAGPLFASLLARELGIRTIVVPRHAGNFSAWGLLDQDVVRSAARTILSPLDDDGLRRAEPTLEALFVALDERVERRVAGTDRKEAEFDLRYRGQEYSLTVPVTIEGLEIAESAAALSERFATAYERKYGHNFDVGVEIVSVRAIERIVLPSVSARAVLGVDHAAQGPSVAEAFSFRSGERREFSILDRAGLAPGSRFEGPAIVLEPTTTSYFDAGWAVTVHEQGAMVASEID